MSLNVNWSTVDAKHKETAAKNGFNIGLTLMIIGVPEISAKTIPTIKKRLFIEHKLFNTVGQETAEWLSNFKGLSCNASTYTDSQYMKKVTKRINELKFT